MDNSECSSLAGVANPRQTAILLVDVQRVFAGLSLYPPVDQVLHNLGRFLDEARALAIPVVVVRMVIPPELYSAVWERQFQRYDETWLSDGADNVDYVSGFEPRENDLVITKHRYSAFIDTPLATMLRARDIRTVVVAGLTTDVCVGSTARDAFQRDFHVITLADCCAEMTQTRHEAALETLADTFGTVCSSTDLVACWHALQPSSPLNAVAAR
jgi:ureidoacrylate peracid hydrolase